MKRLAILISFFGFVTFLTARAEDSNIFYFVERGQTQIKSLPLLKDFPPFLSRLADTEDFKKALLKDDRSGKSYKFEKAYSIQLAQGTSSTFLASYKTGDYTSSYLCWIGKDQKIKHCDATAGMLSEIQLFVDLDGDGIYERILQADAESAMEFYIQKLNLQNLRFTNVVRIRPVVKLGEKEDVGNYGFIQDLSQAKEIELNFAEKKSVKIQALPIHCYAEANANSSVLETMYFPLVAFKIDSAKTKGSDRFVGPLLTLTSLPVLIQSNQEYKKVSACSKNSDCKTTAYVNGYLVSNQSFVVPKFCNSETSWVNFSSQEGLNPGLKDKKPECSDRTCH